MPFKGRGRKEGRGRFFKGGVGILCYETIGTVIKLAAFVWFSLNFHQFFSIINVFIAIQPWKWVFLSTKGDTTFDFATF